MCQCCSFRCDPITFATNVKYLSLVRTIHAQLGVSVSMPVIGDAVCFQATARPTGRMSPALGSSTTSTGNLSNRADSLGAWHVYCCPEMSRNWKGNCSRSAGMQTIGLAVKQATSYPQEILKICKWSVSSKP